MKIKKMLDFFRYKYRLKIIQNYFFILFFLTISQTIKAADKSLSFDGTDDFVEIAANSVLNPTGDYTVAAWFKQEGNNTANTWQSVITSRMKVANGNAKGYVMYLNPIPHKVLGKQMEAETQEHPVGIIG